MNRLQTCLCWFAVGMMTLSMPSIGNAVTPTETVLHTFGSSLTDGTSPYSGVIMDAAGNLYGTTQYGGAHGYGTVFEVAAGTQAETVLYSFGVNTTDGLVPSANLISDPQGNLYGTTSGGGAQDEGTVFEIAAGTYEETVLHSFGASSTDGQNPVGNAGLISDSDGNLYGTTYSGGTNNLGTVYEISAGSHTESVVYSFGSSSNDGNRPQGSLISDSAGNLYGTTYSGGTNNLGTVFEIAAGTHNETVLHSFIGSDGALPSTVLISDSAGNLYGTTEFGGSHGNGTVFEIAAGTHEESVLCSFGSSSTDGFNPFAGLISDAAGNLYGTTEAGGLYNEGTIFKIAAVTHVETILYSFSGGIDGGHPFASSLISDTFGNLYGTTTAGGNTNIDLQNGETGDGTVFELSNTGFVVPETSSLLLAAMGMMAFAASCVKRMRAAK